MAFQGLTLGANIRFGYDSATGEFGWQLKLTNKSGASTTKGYICCPSSTTDNAFTYVATDDPDPNWVIYEAGIADGSAAWVWMIGSVCEVYCVSANAGANGADPLRHWLIRASTSTDDAGAKTTGYAACEPLPAPPLSVDKHFYEAGHIVKSRTGAGLTLCSLHYN